ncbi:MAG: TIGR04255 family protein [candidate division Zixibacteria bacterium]|nr:TIGR04255 family protein [Candidatus Tariuqbacter arcticus]
MPFPEVKRVIYKKNPLDRVICQLRFPPILKIDKEIPADFQEKIRMDFPNFDETIEWPDVPSEIQGQFPPEILRQISQTAPIKNYKFASDDNIWIVNLTRTFIALTSTKYERWEEFKGKLQNIFNAFIETHNPNYFSRIGLRYVDVVKRSDLNLDGKKWNDLLKPFAIGLLGSPDVGKYVQNYEAGHEIKLSKEAGIVKMRLKLVKHIDSGEECFMIDSDFYNASKTRIESATEILDQFNKRASRLIQWVITKELHNTLEPQELC